MNKYNNHFTEILSWIEEKNNSLKVNIKKVSIDDTNWFLDNEGIIRNMENSFFQIRGLKKFDEFNKLIVEQPIIIQDEIGYLGIICKIVDGEMYFLMQAKIEPGNVNKIQISPTIQATKSNFTQRHGGKKPAYLDYFLNAKKSNIMVDQIQSEQSSRFLGKRNRNTIISVDEKVEVLDSHMWMTLEQIKELMKMDNLVNMDTRTVLSCIPYLDLTKEELMLLGYPINEYIFNSFLNNYSINVSEIYKKINDYKMFNDDRIEVCGLNDLKSWNFLNDEFVCKAGYHFKLIFCEIEIEGREVRKWTQPLFEAVGKAIFGLIIKKENDMYKFLVKITDEIGAFDKVELGPTVQLEADYNENQLDEVQKIFFEKWKLKEGILFDTILSEEGGRFYHEQNHNVIIEVDENELRELPKEYIWTDLKTLYSLIRVNNVLNIQLRNLLSCLEA